MNNLFQIAIDSAGRLWVADTDNNRVLRFDSAASMANGANADGVLGQPNFTSSTNTATQSGMGAVLGVAADSAGRLWVADYDNSRVLRFDSAASKANGANADGVLGQPNFTSLAFATTQSVMGNPAGVATDSAGRLWVVDSGNSRVLWFDTAASKANGANADGVLGQPNFTSSSIATTQSGMNFPGGVAVDSVGRVWVGDSSNNRVLLFGPPVSSNADLSGLGLSNGTLSPAFAAATTSYTVDVGNGISSLTITPTLADEGATVTVNGVAVSTGSASAAIPLSFGTNTITVVVTASDGVTTKTYTIVVTRATQYSVRLVLVVKP
jgi:sugar lactone lactonase YvrE